MVKWRRFWINKRFNKVKTIEAEKEKLKEYGPENISLTVVDGEESKTGKGPVEINFKDIHRKTDLMLELENAETEAINIKDGVAYFWIPKKEVLKEEDFKLYYGCNHRLARLFDRFFHQKHEEPKNLEAVYHVTDSLQ